MRQDAHAKPPFFLPPLMPPPPSWSTHGAPPAPPTPSRAELQRERRRADQQRRAALHANNQRAFSGLVTIGEYLRALLTDGKAVKTRRGSWYFRATFTGVLTCGEHSYKGHFVLLQDNRARGYKARAEIVWTGAEWRVHIWRAPAESTRDLVVIECHAPLD